MSVEEEDAACLQMLGCMLHLMDHMDNDIVLSREVSWGYEMPLMARVGGEILLTKDQFWKYPPHRALLRGRYYRMVHMRL